LARFLFVVVLSVLVWVFWLRWGIPLFGGILCTPIWLFGLSLLIKKKKKTRFSLSEIIKKQKLAEDFFHNAEAFPPLLPNLDYICQSKLFSINLMDVVLDKTWPVLPILQRNETKKICFWMSLWIDRQHLFKKSSFISTKKVVDSISDVVLSIKIFLHPLKPKSIFHSVGIYIYIYIYMYYHCMFVFLSSLQK
jgi:hypothetical protein